jgi:hypothetical protein
MKKTARGSRGVDSSAAVRGGGWGGRAGSGERLSVSHSPAYVADDTRGVVEYDI